MGATEATRQSGVLMLFVGKRGSDATYIVRGEVTKEHVHFDFGPVGEIDATVQATGRMETVGSQCGKPRELEGQEYVGTIVFHGEEGFTEAAASRVPLRLGPIFNLVCGAPVLGGGSEEGHGLSGAGLWIAREGGPRLQLEQNHAGARVFYEAHMTEKTGAVRVNRTVRGRLGGGALHYDPSLSAASFSAGAPFSGRATYAGRRPAYEAHAGEGTWRGSLTVDFPGRAGVRVAGPGFSASIAHAKRMELQR